MMETIAHQYKDPSNNFNHFNIDGHIEEKCWKLHLDLNLKNYKKAGKKNNIIATDSSNQDESSSDLDENILCKSM